MIKAQDHFENMSAVYISGTWFDLDSNIKLIVSGRGHWVRHPVVGSYSGGCVHILYGNITTTQ